MMDESEKYNTKGTDFMKTSEYQQAIDEYTRAIALNPYNVVYYCNRAAAYIRLMKDLDAVNDCKEAIKLDPTYEKAYGYLGLAYSNLNKYDLALQAYQTALKYDPTNHFYETNRKVAQEKLRTNPEGAAPTPDPRQSPDNFSRFLNNPIHISMATQILRDPNCDRMMSGLMNNMSGTGIEGTPAAVEAMMQAGLLLAEREYTEVYNRVARNVQPIKTENSARSNINIKKEPGYKKDPGSA